MGLANSSDANLTRYARVTTRVLIGVVLVRSILVVIAWAFGLDLSLALLVTGPSTKFLPPLLNFLVASALVLLSSTSAARIPPEKRGRVFQRLTFLFGAVVSLVALATVIEYLFGITIGIDNLLVINTAPGPPEIYPGRMSPNAAAAFFCLGTSIALFSTSRFIRTAQLLALGSCAIAILALMGHAYGVNHLYSFTGLASMSVVGAIWILLLSIGAFMVVPDRGMMRLLTSSLAGGVMARRLFLATLIIPPILGGISLGGFKDLFYDTPFSISLLVIMSMIIFGAITSALSVRLETADTRSREAEILLSTSREELRELSTHVQDLQEEERIRIAREIHDELGQSLTAIKMDVSLLKNAAKEDSETRTERLDSILNLVNSTIHTVQRISTELRPGVLDDLGLTAALEWQTQEFQIRTGIIASLTVRPPEVTTDQQRSTALFRIFQETLTNVARHAHARRVSILLEKADQSIRLCITDDGRGIDASSLTRTESLGLIGMRERVNLLGGTIQITGAPDAGTTVEVVIPLESSNAALS